MRWQARITDDFVRGGLTVYLVAPDPTGTSILGPGGTLQTRLSQETLPPDDLEPTLRFTDDQARALLAALLRWYDGGEDTRTLRADYLAERARSDKLVDAIIGLARPVDLAALVQVAGRPL